MREPGDQRLRRDLPVGLRRAIQLVFGLLALVAIYGAPARALAGPPPIPPGREDAILELVAPIELGDQLDAAHTLHSMTIDGSTIVFWIAPPDLQDPKDGSQYGQVRLHHPDYAPPDAKQILGFAISTEQPGESGASVQQVAARIEANADGSFWGLRGSDGPGGAGGPLETPDGPWRAYLAALVLLGAFGLALREHEHAWMPVAVVVAVGCLAAIHAADVCAEPSISSRSVRAIPGQRPWLAGGLGAVACGATWLLAMRLGLSKLAALAAAAGLGMSPWLVPHVAADASTPIVVSLLVIAFSFAVEAVGTQREGPALLFGGVALFALALALRGSHALMVAVMLVPLLRRCSGPPSHLRWMLAMGLGVALVAGLPSYLEHGVGHAVEFSDVVAASLQLVHPATGHPVVSALALVGLLAPKRSKPSAADADADADRAVADLRWLGLAWFVVALSTGSCEMATVPWVLLAGRGFSVLFDERPRLRVAAVAVVIAGALLAGVVYGSARQNPQTERCG